MKGALGGRVALHTVTTSRGAWIGSTRLWSKSARRAHRIGIIATASTTSRRLRRHGSVAEYDANNKTSSSPALPYTRRSRRLTRRPDVRANDPTSCRSPPDQLAGNGPSHVAGNVRHRVEQRRPGWRTAPICTREGFSRRRPHESPRKRSMGEDPMRRPERSHRRDNRARLAFG